MKTPRRGFPWLAGACCLAAGAWLSAAAEDAAPAASEDGAPPTAPVQIKPRPSEIMPKATQALILGVIDTGEHLIAVGDRGEILASNDGRAWAQVPTPVRAALTAVSFADPQHGWAVGHDAVVLHTGDGGRSWTLQNFQPELQEPFLDVLALDPNHAYAVGAYGLFEQTTDGGANWTKVEAPASTARWGCPPTAARPGASSNRLMKAPSSAPCRAAIPARWSAVCAATLISATTCARATGRRSTPAPPIPSSAARRWTRIRWPWSV